MLSVSREFKYTRIDQNVRLQYLLQPVDEAIFKILPIFRYICLYKGGIPDEKMPAGVHCLWTVSSWKQWHDQKHGQANKFEALSDLSEEDVLRLYSQYML